MWKGLLLVPTKLADKTNISLSEKINNKLRKKRINEDYATDFRSFYETL